MATSVNTVAKHILAQYLNYQNPGYALLIDAPWGAGKTHFIKKNTNYENDAEILYVSLSSVKTLDDFNKIVLRSFKPFGIDEGAYWGEKLKGFTAGIKVFGCSLDFDRIPLEEFVLSKLPDTLIFDDLERCSMEHDQLSGLLNQFIEHDKKHIILIANTNEHKEQNRFVKTREKLIGKTVTIEADIDEAIIAIWSDIKDSKAKKFLKSIQKELLEVFHEASHNNLRVAKYALIETVNFLKSVDDNFFKNKSALTRVTITYFALCMAYRNGSITNEDLKKRNSYKILTSKETEKTEPIRKLQESHPNCDILEYRQLCLPVELSLNLFNRGYASKKEITNALNSTFEFSKPADKPDWVRLWNWAEESLDDIHLLLKNTENKLQNLQITHPGEIIQTYCAMKFMAKFGAFEENETEIHNKFMKYIERLKKNKKIPEFIPAIDNLEKAEKNNNNIEISYSLYGYDFSDNRVSFGGYSCELDDEKKEFIDSFRKMQDQFYQEKRDNYAKRLILSFKQDKDTFLDYFQYQNIGLNFYNYPILDLIDPRKFASILLDYFLNEIEYAKEVCKILSERRSPHRELCNESNWYDEMTYELRKIADQKSRIIRAKTERNIQWYLNPDI